MAVAKVKCQHEGCDFWLAALLSDEQIEQRMGAHRWSAHGEAERALAPVSVSGQLANEVAALAAGKLACAHCKHADGTVGCFCPEPFCPCPAPRAERKLATNPDARIEFTFRGTPTEFRAWCRAYADGAGK
jgi:hypothetical protein